MLQVSRGKEATCDSKFIQQGCHTDRCQDMEAGTGRMQVSYLICSASKLEGLGHLHGC